MIRPEQKWPCFSRVNSLRCKNCSFGDPDCNSGNVPERECLTNQVCYAIRFFSPGQSDQTVTLRGCTANDEGNHCVDVDETWKECHLYCYTDNCNSASNIGEE
ncbi:uncharacterized protein LOC112577380 [Pomacea canaliculata]|uniref:uncharacterized protein LOC112577380 n=1 Tax=Pomacea canaliculata TaxID=400727 RepID=UPI000D73478C|nr:uncharacterized protein LOC112577380 [Pomacea canaliculata]